MNGAERIAKERARQIDELQWDWCHDDQEHADGDLALVAALYASPARLAYPGSFSDPWPWSRSDDKRKRKDGAVVPNAELPTEARIRLLEKAGALIAAEIDRLLRLPVKP